MIPPARHRALAEGVFVDALTAAGLTAGVKRPATFPNSPEFLVLFLNGGEHQNLVTETAAVELEAWARTKTAALQLMLRATNALEAASFTRGLREIREDHPPVSLDTGTEGWFRYTTSLTAQQRTR
ncbi:hypothetical protein [Kocuria sp.]|uniref:hypothetical protein n=1 Tax=Kocuria sp. TaxID=1871328 RepID=UPI0026DAEE4E|nr:hypothetical protein [Kocuria sp.]MDO4920094.1 hypothetical protein [Kocuria sp.]